MATSKFGKAFAAAKTAPKTSSGASRRSNRGQSYAKGGMVKKSNCGASVPTSKKR